MVLPSVSSKITNHLAAQQCTENFRDMVTTDGSRRGRQNGIQTRLIPSMRLSCRGTITGFTAGGRSRNGDQDPKIQVWRENKTQCGFYYRPVPDINITTNSDVCTNVTTIPESKNKIFHCVLRTSARVSVLPGDILGIELPPTNDDRFRLFFTNQNGERNYVFNQQVASTIELAMRTFTVRHQPQITLDITSGE